MGDRGRGHRPGYRGGFRKSDPDAQRISSTVQIFVEGLPLDAKVPELQKYFQSVGPIKCDRETKKPRVWLYHDKVTNLPTGECTITYKDAPTQVLALQTYDGQHYNGMPIRVTPSIVRAHMAKPPPPPPPGSRGRGRGRGGPRGRGGGDRGGRGRGGGGFRGGDRDRHGGRGGNYEQLGAPRRDGGGGPVRDRPTIKTYGPSSGGGGGSDFYSRRDDRGGHGGAGDYQRGDDRGGYGGAGDYHRRDDHGQGGGGDYYRRDDRGYGGGGSSGRYQPY